MEKKAIKSTSKANFLESIPSQLRYAYLALKKKQEAKPVKLRDRDKDLNDIISGHSFGFLSFERICKSEFEPEDCLLRFDAVTYQLVLEMSSSKVNACESTHRTRALPIYLLLVSTQTAGGVRISIA
jgi:hypothetical protein